MQIGWLKTLESRVSSSGASRFLLAPFVILALFEIRCADSYVSTVTTGGAHTCVLLGGGGAACWGFNGNGQLGVGTIKDAFSPLPIPSGPG